MQRCAAEDKLDMVSASVHMLALRCGGLCPVAGRHFFFYEGRIPPWWTSCCHYLSGGHIIPLFQCAVAGGQLCVCGHLYSGAHRVPRIGTCGRME